MTETEIVDLTQIVGEIQTPCDFHESWGDLHHGAAQWIAVRVQCVCGDVGGARLICTDCKDVLMLSEDAIQCVSCDEIYQPARTIVSSIEPI